MTWYDLDFSEEAEKELDEFFSAHPYKLSENKELGKTVAVSVNGKEEIILSYWNDRMSIYSHNAERLPRDVKEQILGCLSKIKNKLDSRSSKTLDTILEPANWYTEEREKLWGRKSSD